MMFNSPGHLRQRLNPYVAQLLSRNVNNGTAAGGGAHVLQNIMAGMSYGQERRAEEQDRADRVAAQKAFAEGMTPTGNPHFGPGKVPGSLSKAARLLSNQPNNPYAADMGQQVAMMQGQQQMADQRAEANRLADLGAYEDKLQIAARYEQPDLGGWITAYSPQGDPKTVRENSPEAAQLFQAGYTTNAPASQLPFSGTGMDAQAWNILTTGDPTTPEYQAAYSHLSQPRVTVGQDGAITTVTPDLSAFAKPGGQAPMMAAAAPQDASQAPAPGATQTSVGGATVTQTPAPPVVDQQAIDDANYSIQLVDDLVGHPGMSDVVGMPGSVSGAVTKVFGTPIPGTDAAGFNARLEQLGGRQFLQAFESLKGGGHITEIEGEKATNAMSRLAQTGQSEAEYRQAAEELKAILKRSIVRAGGQTQQPIGQGAPGPARMRYVPGKGLVPVTPADPADRMNRTVKEF